MDLDNAIAWLETGAMIVFAVTVWVLFLLLVVHVEAAGVTGSTTSTNPSRSNSSREL